LSSLSYGGIYLSTFASNTFFFSDVSKSISLAKFVNFLFILSLSEHKFIKIFVDAAIFTTE